MTDLRERPVAARTAEVAGAGAGVWAVLVLALVTGLLGVAAVLAPVVADDAVVTWPRAGEAPVSTTLPLSPYRPLTFAANIPCATLAALDRRGGGEALRTLPADVDPVLGSGLVVGVTAGVVRVSTGAAPGPDTQPVPDLVTEPLPGGGCDYAVTADTGGITVTRDGIVLVRRPDLLPPQVAELETAAAPEDAAGLRVELRPDARYQSVPSVPKVLLLAVHGLALVALLVLARRVWPGRPRPIPRPRIGAPDVVVVLVSAAWVIIGPLNIDDSWYVLMARGAQTSGYVGNAIYQFNVTENPFVLSQYALQAWGTLGGWSLPWLRLVPLAYGLATYAVLRLLFAVTLGRVARVPAVSWALGGAHLLWFLGYGITLRPEPLIVLGTAVTWLLVELARPQEMLEPTSTPAVAPLAGAVAVAGLTLTVSPTGLVAVAPLVLALPFLWRWWCAALSVTRFAAAALAAAVLTVVVPVGFTDASLGDVLESIAVHSWYYRQHPWHDELVHYANLLDQSDRGSWGRRLPVLLTLAVLATALVRLGRWSGTGGVTGRLLSSSALITVLGLVSMTLTPTKWVNHFGAVAAPATVLLAMALVRSPLPRQAARSAVGMATALAVGAAAVSFAGPNLWRPFSDWGQPFGNHALIGSPYEISRTVPGIGPLDLSNPLLWLAVAAAAVLWRRHAQQQRAPVTIPATQRSTWAAGRVAAPERAVLGVAVTGGVALFLVVFVAAPISHAPGASPATMNLAALTGTSRCGLADNVVVGTDETLAGTVVADAPVFADQVSALLWPCVEQVGIRHGIAETPQVRLRAGDLLEGAIEDNSVFVPNGGALAGVDRTSRFVELPSALDPAGGSPMAPWGHVEIVFPDHPPGRYDLAVGRVDRPGWTRLPTLAGERYTGRTFIG